MSEIIILLVFLFFAVLGVSAFTAKLWLLLIKPKGKMKCVSVVKLNENQAKETVAYYLEKYRWYGKEYADYVIFLCKGQPDEFVKKSVKAHNNLMICNEETLTEYINSI